MNYFTIILHYKVIKKSRVSSDQKIIGNLFCFITFFVRKVFWYIFLGAGGCVYS